MTPLGQLARPSMRRFASAAARLPRPRPQSPVGGRRSNPQPPACRPRGRMQAAGRGGGRPAGRPAAKTSKQVSAAGCSGRRHLRKPGSAT